MAAKGVIIVTGANGYVGRYVVAECVKQGYPVVALKYKHPRSTLYDHPSVKYVYCDIVHLNKFEKDIMKAVGRRKVAGVIHLAALLGESQYQKNYAVNSQGTKNVADFCLHNKIKRLVYLSTVCTIKKIKGPYGETKKIGEKFVVDSGLQYSIFIPALILGVQSLGLNRILKNMFRFPLVIPLVGSGKHTQHPIYVKDLAWCLVKSISTKSCFKKVYLIAGDKIVSFRKFVRMILKAKKRSKIFVPVPSFFVKMAGGFFSMVCKRPPFTAEHVKGLMQDSKLDTRPLRKDLGFTATPLGDALAEVLREARNDHEYYLKPRKEKIIRL